MKQQLSGWGRYPILTTALYQPESLDGLRQLILEKKSMIARGNGRSYGDSALGQSVISLLKFNRFFAFDAQRGHLTCGAGVLLAEIIRECLPKGWFLPVTPGTQYVTLGGAIASDVHGKNHHRVGCLSQFIETIELLLPTGEVVHCSGTVSSDLFAATCGGMGLTGIILSATIRLMAVEGSAMLQTVVRVPHFEALMEQFQQHHMASYSVAWLDGLARGRHLGRALLLLGEHHPERLPITRPSKWVPARLLRYLLNDYSIKGFNVYYYHRPRATLQVVDYQTFFYPLDHMVDWNQLYGSKGFIQYQCVLPHDCAAIGMRAILKKLSDYRRGVRLAVMKPCGPSNTNLLSFPLRGLSLAFDMVQHEGLLTFIHELDSLVCEYGGRIYLTKDACVTADRLAMMYKNLTKFRAIRERSGADQRFQSRQSMRLHL